MPTGGNSGYNNRAVSGRNEYEARGTASCRYGPQTHQEQSAGSCAVETAIPLRNVCRRISRNGPLVSEARPHHLVVCFPLRTIIPITAATKITKRTATHQF